MLMRVLWRILMKTIILSFSPRGGEPIDMSNGTSNIMTALGMYKQVIGEDIGAGITTGTLISTLGITPETMRIETDSGVGDMYLGSTTSIGALINNINNLGIGCYGVCEFRWHGIGCFRHKHHFNNGSFRSEKNLRQ